MEEDVLFRRSTDNGLTFESVKLLSTSPGFLPKICSTGGTVHVVWDDVGPVYTRSTDLGNTFEPVRTLSTMGTASQVVSIGNTTLVFWVDGTSLCYRRSTDNGADFNDMVRIYPAGNALSIATSDAGIYLAWQDMSSPPEIFFIRSIDAGASFISGQNLSFNGGVSCEAMVAASSNNVFVTWVDDTDGEYDVLLRASPSGGSSFGSTLKLSLDPGDSVGTTAAASGDYAFVAWQREDSSLWDVFLSYSSNGGAAFFPPDNISSDRYSALTHVIANGPEALIIWKSWITGGGDIYFTKLRK